MSDAAASLFARSLAWARRCRECGWLTDAQVRDVDAIERAAPSDLFQSAEQGRPLVIALFGGTGVGKSSLLNRLAGEALARVGVERPTSTEATAYLHESVGLHSLPPELPVDRVRICRHRDSERRDAMWIDAPDMDSTRADNRALVLAWLPHVDVVIYVVSPERYRDDAGWRTLLSRGHRHGWLFVMNRWDEGQPEQHDDFVRMLREAGFDAPFVLRTCCATTRDGAATDDFDQIEAIIRQILLEHGVRELDRLGQRARLLDLRAALAPLPARMGDESAWRKLGSAWTALTRQRLAELRVGLEWPIGAAAARFARSGQAEGAGWLAGVRRAVLGLPPPAQPHASADAPAESLPDASAQTAALWDEWAGDKLRELSAQFELEMARVGIATTPTVGRLAEAFEPAAELLRRLCDDRVRAALARPGTWMQRAGRRVTGFLMVTAPALAACWVAYAAWVGFHRATRGESAYLGGDFAVHAALVVGLAALLPWIADRALKPRIERTVAEALRGAVHDALAELDRAAGAALQAAIDEAIELRREAHELDAAVSAMALRPVAATKSAIGRLLATPQRAGVGATR